MMLPGTDEAETTLADAVEGAALAIGRFVAVAEGAGDAVGRTLLRRHVVLAGGHGDDAGRALITANTTEPKDDFTRHYAALVERIEGATPLSARVSGALAQSGLAAAPTEAGRTAVIEVLDAARPRESIILRAAVVAGAIVSPAPASGDAARAAALASSLVLTAGGLTPAPWLAPWHLDAVARSAAVQVDRSNSWIEWLRAWCHLLEREATTAERAVRMATARLADERATVRRQPRVGATDDLVVTWLHERAAFTIKDAAVALGLTTPTVGTSIERLEATGLATELTGQQRDRIWTSTALLALATTA